MNLDIYGSGIRPMLFSVVHILLPFWKDLPPYQLKLRAMLVGVVGYIVLHAFLFSKMSDRFPRLQHWRELIYLLCVVDALVMAFWFQKRDSKKVPNEVQQAIQEQVSALPKAPLQAPPGVPPPGLMTPRGPVPGASAGLPPRARLHPTPVLVQVSNPPRPTPTQIPVKITKKPTAPVMNSASPAPTPVVPATPVPEVFQPRDGEVLISETVPPPETQKASPLIQEESLPDSHEKLVAESAVEEFSNQERESKSQTPQVLNDDETIPVYTP